AELPPNAVQRTKTSSVVVDQEGPVGLEHEEPNGFRQPRGEAAGVEHFAASESRRICRRTVLSVSTPFAPAFVFRFERSILEGLSPTLAASAPDDRSLVERFDAWKRTGIGRLALYGIIVGAVAGLYYGAGRAGL